MPKKIVIAVSGGVDSGVAASLLLEKGNVEVCGLYMRHRYQPTISLDETRNVLQTLSGKSGLKVGKTGRDGRVTWSDWNLDDFPFPLPVDAVAALRLTLFLGIELVLIDVDENFQTIVEDFVDEYYAARTPNPCVLCNKTIKFGLLWNVAKQIGGDVLATGHYVKKLTVREWLERHDHELDSFFGFSKFSDYLLTPNWLTKDPDEEFLARSPSLKDQTYFLYGVNSKNLENFTFPVGRLSKEQVRELALERNLPVAIRKESQEVCFVPDKKRLEFIRSVREASPTCWKNVSEDTSGDFLSLDGKKIGSHVGYEKFTVGQRKGLGMGFCERIFVQRIDATSHAVVLGSYEKLAVEEIHAVDSNWHTSVPIDEEFRCEIKIRYRNESCFATLLVSEDGSVVAKPDVPRFGVAPGQALVCYWRDRLLGGARIVT